LARALDRCGFPDEAEEVYRKADSVLQTLIKEFPDRYYYYYDAGSFANKLGFLLERNCHWRDARRVHEQSISYAREALRLTSGKDSQSEQSLQAAVANLSRVERLIELDGGLDAIVRGEPKPKDAAESIEFALFCLLHKHRNAAAARLFTEAFDANPELERDMNAQHRYNASCAALLAASGQGEDAPSLDDAKRASLRRQALGWLRADLAFWKEQLAGAARDPNPLSSAKLRATVRGTLRHWQKDTDLAGVRDAEELAKLPDAEREGWNKLWVEVTELLEKCGSE
jgi:hypothetical protein